MKLLQLEIFNFRNLNEQKISFNENCNFIVGDNNLGKTNILTLINTIFRNTYRTNFVEDDFTVITKPIEVIFSLKLSDIEVGLFEDLFDSEEENIITIKAIQSGIDEYLEYYHVDSNLKISPSTIKCVNYLYYDSQRDPNKELTFDKAKGVGRFLNHLVSINLKQKGETEIDFIDKGKTDDILVDINTQLCKIKAFKDYNIDAKLEENIENLVAKLFLLKDRDNRVLSQTGYGVQFLTIISLFILDRLLNIGKLKSRKGIFEKDEKKSISLIIGLDEPEIHLHPYLQRSLIKYIQNILKNKDSDFSEILKEAFDIDFFIGQSIIATHSPNVLLKNHREIIRIYEHNGKIEIVSGESLTLNHKLGRHLQIQFPFIKEAFFARAALIVEGDSELASFQKFALKINENYDFDELGIALIQAGGEGSIPPLIELFTKFKIPSLGMIDKDISNVASSTIKITHSRNFECEILALIDQGKIEVLENILEEYDSLGKERVMQKKALKKNQTKYPGVLDQNITLANTKYLNIAEDNLELKKIWFLTWLIVNKNILLGGIIGNNLSVDDIPQCYVDIIEEIVALSTS